MNPTRDRYGEPIEDPAAEHEQTEHDCDNGWLDRDGDLPQPCLICRPHLAPPPRPPRPDQATARAGSARCRAALANASRRRTLISRPEDSA